MQHALEKLAPGIHYLNDKSDLELRQAFTIKLQPTIQKEILSRAAKYESLQELISVAEPFESVILGTTKRDWMPQLHALPASTAVRNPLMGYLSHVFPMGHLTNSRNIAQRILKPRVPSLPLRKKLQQCVRSLTGLRRHPVKEPTLRAEFTNVQCVTSWLQIQLRLSLQSRCNPWHLEITQLILHNQRLKRLQQVLMLLRVQLSTSVPDFGLPEVSDISSQLQNCLNLSEKNILWRKLEPGAIPVPLPVMSFCFTCFKGTCYECKQKLPQFKL